MLETKSEIKSAEVIWLQPEHLHFHHGQEVRLKVLQGAGMKPGGTLETAGLSAWVANPGGAGREIEVTDAGGYGSLAFEAGEDGVYTVTVAGEAGLARVLVPVGHHVSGRGRPGGSGLEIIPLYFYEFRHKDTAEIQVLLDGRPLSGAEVKAACHFEEGPEPYPYRAVTNERGLFLFTFREKGHWLLVVEHGLKYATLTIPGVR